MLEDDHRPGRAESREGQSLGITRQGRHHDLKPWKVAEERLKTLRMRRTLTPALPDDRPDDDRNPEPAPVHVSRLRRQIDHLVRRQKHEIIACMNDHHRTGSRD